MGPTVPPNRVKLQNSVYFSHVLFGGGGGRTLYCRSIYMVFCNSHVIFGVIIVSGTAVNIPGVRKLSIVSKSVLYGEDIAVYT